MTVGVYAPVVRISLLGPLVVEGDGGGAMVLNAAKERSLVTVLALSPGRDVGTDTLMWALWGDEPPAAARKTLQTYIWNLRQAFGSDRIATCPTGYRLLVDDGDVDVHRFRDLTRKGDEAMRRGEVALARSQLADALALWRGRPFADVAQHTGLATEAERLEQERLSALEARIAADLADGRHHELVGELEALIDAHPFRERLWGQLMVALYRGGRQADALAAYQRARAVLAEELGLEPGGELRRVESAVLNHEIGISTHGSTTDALPTGSIRPTPVRYARTADGTAIAYQVAGSGAVDVLAVPGYVHHLDIWWNAPTDRLVRRLTSTGRLVVFDKRGMGLSDRPDAVDVDAWTLDALAVLDAAGIERAVILGVAAGAITALQLAAQHPDRVRALVLHEGFARQLVAPDYDIGFEPAIIDAYADNMERGWGTGVALSSAAPSLAHDPTVRAYWARYQRLSASPTGAVRLLHASAEADVRELLSSIHVPTLVIHAKGDLLIPLAQGRYVADHIAGADFIVLDSDVHLICVSDVLEQVADHIEAFVQRLDT